MQNDNADAEMVGAKPTGHERIRAAITDQSDVVGEFQNLLQLIQYGPEVPEPDAPDKVSEAIPMESVMDVLENGAGKINSNTVLIRKLAGDIKAALYRAMPPTT